MKLRALMSSWNSSETFARISARKARRLEKDDEEYGKMDESGN